MKEKISSVLFLRQTWGKIGYKLTFKTLFQLVKNVEEKKLTTEKTEYINDKYQICLFS